MVAHIPGNRPSFLGLKKAGVYPYNRNAVLTLETGCNNSRKEREENGGVSESPRSNSTSRGLHKE